MHYKVWHSPSFLKRICAGNTGTDTKAHNPTQRWDQEPGWTRRNGDTYLPPAHGASHTNTPAAAMHPPASFGFSEVKQVLLALPELQTYLSQNQVVVAQSLPSSVLPTAPYNSAASQPLSARDCDTSQPCPHCAHIHAHFLSSRQEAGFAPFPISQPRHSSFCQCLQTTGQSDYFQSLRNIRYPLVDLQGIQTASPWLT